MNKAKIVGTTLLILLIFVAAGCADLGSQTRISAPVVVQPAPPPQESTGLVPVDKPKSVVILNSYEPDYWATVDENKGIIDGLATIGFKEGENIKITRLYMNTKTINNTHERMEATAQEMVNQTLAAIPDLIFITDDDALVHVGSKLLDFTDHPVVFSGINGDPTSPNYTAYGPLVTSLTDNTKPVTGILERTQFKPGFELLKEIYPDAQTALFITDNSSVSELVLRDAGGDAELDDVALEVVRKVSTDSYEEIQSLVLEYQDKVDAIVLFLAFTIFDGQGRHVPEKEVVRWLVQNNRLPGVAFWNVLSEEGILVGSIVDMEQQGFHAGLRGGRILLGERPYQMPIVDPVANKIALNLARADQLKADIPFSLLKQADIVHLKMAAYPEYQIATE